MSPVPSRIAEVPVRNMFSIQLRAASSSKKHPQPLSRWETRRSDLEQSDGGHSQTLYTKLIQWHLLRLLECRRKTPSFDKVDRSLVCCRIATAD